MQASGWMGTHPEILLPTEPLWVFCLSCMQDFIQLFENGEKDCVADWLALFMYQGCGYQTTAQLH